MGTSETKGAKETKKFIAIMLIFAICCGLCACGKEEVTLPTKPEQLAAPTQAVAGETQNAEAEESPEAAEPTGETYPWEAEFNEDDYFVYVHNEPQVGKFTGYIVKSLDNLGACVRTIAEYTNGDIEDTYFYPSGLDSHSYRWYADGSYEEFRYLDDGRIDLAEQKTYLGTVIYQKNIAPDGSWSEHRHDENGSPTHSAGMDADGSYWEFQSLADGISREISDNPNTGDRWETEYYENGNIKRAVLSNSKTGECSESECFENGNIKYSKNQTSALTQEDRYVEEGFRTYYYTKNADYEIELISDEVGKLVTIVENGETIEDPAIITQYAQNYNFKE